MMKSLSGVLLVCCFMAVCDSWVYKLFQRTVCYEEIGCFENTSPFNNALSFLPESPTEIGVMYQLFTRENRDSPQTLTNNTNVIRSSNFNGNKATKFIIHGYLDNTTDPWVTKMKDAILQREDANVITVDWSKGAEQVNYAQAVANTRVVGALLSLLMNTLDTVANGSSLSKMHLIGHSLGAHVAGYAGERTLGTGRITGLDPAGPLFKRTNPKVRLDPSDALFVDVIHTNANGFGIKSSVGHVDFYPNGGKRQPGCLEYVLNELFNGRFEQMFSGVACSHMRVLTLFTESINSNCQFPSYPCKWCTTCGKGCANMGYDAPRGNPRGDYFLSTNSQHPFCTFILGQKEVCYNSDGIGCFSSASPYNNANGNLPESPSHIQVQFLLYTRQNPSTAQLITQSTIHGSHFVGSKKTKFIIHGYQDDGRSQWIINMKNAFLHKEDANVIAVNWEKGADNINYMQAAANTRVVGALVAQMMKALHTNGQATYHDMHLIGHSLGSHIAGYAGERVPGTGRITGLDPAGPLFENKDPKVRLDPSDALFVDAIHTDSDDLHELGFGLEKPVGHADFYPNGGENQPGCPSVGKHLFNLITLKITRLVDGVACNHLRVLDLFTESITSTCSFQAMPCPDKTQFAQGRCTSCGHGCAKMGYHASEGNPHGTFYFATNSAAPFCHR